MHVSLECDVSCWSKYGISLRSRWNEDVIGVYAWVVDDPVCSWVSAELSKVFGRCPNVFDGYFFSPIHVFGWFGHDVGGVECRGMWELSEGIVVRSGKVR